ncbi:MAG: hypothetical protein GY878_19570 [Fuerstiella sp.]|nr:hypothetical protein [Fuerstiella sp.]
MATGPRIQMAEHGGSSSFLSRGELVYHLGTGEAKKVD